MRDTGLTQECPILKKSMREDSMDLVVPFKKTNRAEVLGHNTRKVWEPRIVDCGDPSSKS